jgi:16S rRNA (cytidine1402-2'-O)-methyltransferase
MTAGKLVVCGTPCGNLEDASPRLARALAAADLIACGDPARTRELLARLGVQASAAGLHQVGEGELAERLADRVAAGALVALVADAGAPGASDPGRHLVAACLARGLVVELVPGPSAVPPALLVSGLPSDRFCCEGWLPDRAGARDRRLAELAAEPRTMVFFEAPARVPATLAAMAETFGERRACAVVPEPDGAGEQVLRGPLAEVRERLAAEGPGGGLTLVVAGAPATGEAAAPSRLAAEVAALVAAGSSTRDAVAAVAETSGTPRRAVYQAVLDARRRPG